MPIPIFLLLFVITSAFANSHDEFAGGSGTAGDIWLIATAWHLDNVRNYIGGAHSDKHFKQIADIDLGMPPWNHGEG